MAYVTLPKKPQPSGPVGTPAGCFVCQALASSPDQDRENLLVWRTETACVVLNRFPYNNGHLLVCPNRHEGEFNQLSTAEHSELQGLIGRLIGILKKMMKPDGFNVGLNLGAAAGAGLPGHLHWHIVPRWDGDTNFMPVLSDVKVIVQSLDTLYDMLRAELERTES